MRHGHSSHTAVIGFLTYLCRMEKVLSGKHLCAALVFPQSGMEAAGLISVLHSGKNWASLVPVSLLTSENGFVGAALGKAWAWVGLVSPQCLPGGTSISPASGLPSSWFWGQKDCGSEK